MRRERGRGEAGMVSLFVYAVVACLALGVVLVLWATSSGLWAPRPCCDAIPTGTIGAPVR